MKLFSKLFIAVAVLSSQPVQALTFDNPLGTLKDPNDIIIKVVSWALSILGVVCLIMVLVSGGMWMFAGGNEERARKARMTLVWTVIGLVLVLASYAILQLVFEELEFFAS